MRMPSDKTLDDAVHKWFPQLCSAGLAVRGIYIQPAVKRLTKQLVLKKF